MIGWLVTWGRRRKIRRLGREVGKWRLRKEVAEARYKYWGNKYIAGPGERKSASQCNLEADLLVEIAKAERHLKDLEPVLVELEREELKIGLWAAERAQAAKLARLVEDADIGSDAELLAKQVLAWAAPQ